VHDEDRRIKRRVREAHAAAGSPSYAELAARINAAHPDAEATESRVSQWLWQGENSVVIPARLIAPLAEVLDTTVGRLLGVADDSWDRSQIDEVMARLESVEAALSLPGDSEQSVDDDAAAAQDTQPPAVRQTGDHVESG
jgi:hypothetical protein